MSSQPDETAAFAAGETSVSPEKPVSLPAKLGDLRERAARYMALADALRDPRVIAVVRACARDLEAEASLLADAGRSLRRPGRLKGGADVDGLG